METTVLTSKNNTLTQALAPALAVETGMDIVHRQRTVTVNGVNIEAVKRHLSMHMSADRLKLMSSINSQQIIMILTDRMHVEAVVALLWAAEEDITAIIINMIDKHNIAKTHYTTIIKLWAAEAVPTTPTMVHHPLKQRTPIRINQETLRIHPTADIISIIIVVDLICINRCKVVILTMIHLVAVHVKATSLML